MCDLLLTPQAVLRRSARRAQRGTALVLSLITVMIIASLGAGLVQLHTAIDKRSEFAIDRRRALYLAEAGLAEASLAVSQGRSGNIASEAVPARFGRGVYWVEADDLPGDRMALRCTAQLGTAEFVVRTMVLPNVNPVTSLGFFGSDGVTVGWGSVIDGYHSGDGSYTSQVDTALPVLSTGEMGLIGSDSDIILKETTPTDEETLGLSDATIVAAGPSLSADTGAGSWADLAGGTDSGTGSTGGLPTVGGSLPLAGTAVAASTLPTYPTHIYGRLRPGTRSTVQSGGLSIIDGEIAPFDTPPTLPEITLPTPAEYLSGSISITMDQTNVGANVETWVQENITVTAGAVLTLKGPALLRCQTMNLEQGAILELDDAEGAIHIYASEGFNFRPGTTVRSTSDEAIAHGTYLFVPGAADATDRITIRSQGKFHGALYAPDDILRIPQGLHWIGSAVARVVFAAPGSHLTHDQRVTIGGNGLPAIPRQLSWQVVPMGKEIARQLPIDPMLALALRGVTPVASSVGAIETDLDISYIDSSGQAALYSGTLDSFPRASAQRILAARWTDPRDGAIRSWATPTGTESTNAVAQNRKIARRLKTLIQAGNPLADVAALEEGEVLGEVSSLMVGLDISAEPIEVQRAVQRVDPATVTLMPDPLETSSRAVLTADEFYFKALSIQTTAEALPVLASNVAADPMIIALRAAVNATDQAAIDARARDQVAQISTGAAQITAAQQAAAFAEEAMKQCNIADNLLSQLEVLPL